ncbi:RNA-binding protein Lupus La [Artemisia annua]|uniref:RNA-binding protein Lupus La n=1 Tax=Artemisia annua TaxID=35608 RepID=A0A2U1MBG8_ARTAN|nr:RNA-binding protein Lupus La [Artemisia annua]
MSAVKVGADGVIDSSVLDNNLHDHNERYVVVHYFGRNIWLDIDQAPSKPITGEGVYSNGHLNWLCPYFYSDDDDRTGFRRVQQITKDIQDIVNSLKNSSTVELQDDKLRRRNDWRKWIHTGSQSQTSIEEASLKNLSLEDKPSNEVGPSSSLRLPNGEVSSEEPSS